MISRSQDWVSARVGDEIIMMNVGRGQYVGLTETGSRIWDMLAEPRPANDLCAELCREYEISPEACRVEVDAFLAELKKHGAVAIDLL
jgi:Coenzyme PQQ synthesis protein D (PqqD)